jgi:hypothetical protein
VAVTGEDYIQSLPSRLAQKAFALRLNLSFKDFVARTKPLAVLPIES